MISATDPAAVLLGDLCVHRSAMDNLYVHRSAMDELRHIIEKEPLVNRFISVPIMLYLRGISARDLNHIVVQDDRNAAKHLTDEDERIGERIIASVAPSIYGHDADKDVADKDDADKDDADKDDADKDVADKDVADKDDADKDVADADDANSWSGRQRS